MSEYWMHVDCDCFFASVEMRERPEYRHVPLAVGGSPTGRGVISTCNYPARQFGVRSAMPSWQALKLCPGLILLPGRMSLYKQVSNQVMDVLSGVSRSMEQVSVDEAYLEPNGSDVVAIAEELRAEVERQCGITVSVGIAPNRFLSKVASGWKKPDGMTMIQHSEVNDFVAELPLSAVPGVGPKMTERLLSDGFSMCRDLQSISLPKLIHRYGKFGAILHQRCRGIDNRPLRTGRERKSISVERTFSSDLTTPEHCLEQLPDLWNRWQSRVEAAGVRQQPMSPFVKLRYADFSRTSHSEISVTADYQGFEHLLKNLLATRSDHVRLIGIGARLQPVQPGQGDLFGI